MELLKELKSMDLKLPEPNLFNISVVLVFLTLLLVAMFFYTKNLIKKNKEKKARENEDIAELQAKHAINHARDLEALKKSRWGG